VDVNGRAYADLTVTVSGGSFSSGPVTASVKWADITDPNTLTVTGPDLDKLLAFDISGLDDPTKLFGALLAALQSLDSALHAGGSGNGPLDQPLPLLGKSVHQLLAGVEQGGPGTSYANGTDAAGNPVTTLTDPNKTFDTSYQGRRLLVGSATATITHADGHELTFSPALAAAPADGTSYAVGDQLLGTIDRLAANPSGSLNELVDALNDALGGGVTFGVQPAAGGDPAYLTLSIDWTRTLPVRVPLKFDLDIPNVPSSIVGTNGKGTIDITATGQVTLKLLFPLTAAVVTDPLNSLLIDPQHSTARVTADVTSNGATLAANLGPLALAVGNPDNPSDPGTEIHGKLGFALASSATDPETLSSFFSGLSVTADRTDDVTCDGLSGDLAMCANLPLYYKTGGSWTALGTGITVQVPQDVDFGQLASYVTLPDTDAIQNALASQLIDLSTLGDGLQGYLQLLNTALQLASTAGKLPVVGGDIQQGLDFITGIKNAIESVIPVDSNGGSQQVQTEQDIQNKLDALAGQLQTSLGLPTAPHFFVSTACNATLDAPANLRDGGSAVKSGSSTTYSYRVVAVRTGNTSGTSPASNQFDIANDTALGDTFSNTIEWDASTWATGYQVQKKIGSDWKVLKTVTGTSYQDTGADDSGASTAADPPTVAPSLSPCPGSAITGFKVKVVIGQGTVDAAQGCTGDDCVSAATRPLDLGLPGLSLSTTDPDHPNDLTDPDNGVQAKLGWQLHLSFGLTKDQGFVVYTQDNDSDPHSPDSTQDSTPELAIGAALTAPKQFNGRLAFLSVQAKDTEDAAGSAAHRSFAGVFSVDLHGKGDTPCPVAGCSYDASKVLTLGDITSNDPGDLITAKLQAATSLHYQVTVRSDAALPGIRSDFHLDWSWASGDNPDDTGGLAVGFDNVRVNPGSFLGSVLGPIFDKINALYGPVKPVLDTISAPLPVLSDLSHLAGGGDVSILTLASTFADSSGNADTFNEFVDIFKSVKQVLDTINNLTGSCTGGTDNYDDDVNFCIQLGSFDLSSGGVFSTTNTPDTADSLISGSDPSAQSLFQQINAKTGNGLDGVHNSADTGTGAKNACGAAKDDRGFTFPALENPKSLFGLLMGKDVELVCFDSGPLSLGFTMSESFGPVYAPPPVMIVLSGSANVTAHIVAGFDTYGLRTAIADHDAGTLARAADFLDSLYFKTVDASGKPIPVLQFTGTIAAGAAVSAVIITVGVEGGISLTVSFYWNDPNNDGKFRFREFLATALRNPICLFNVGGELDLFLKVFITIGFSPFSVSFDFTLVNIKLLDFSLKPDCTPPPPELGGKDADGVLYLFAGRLGTGALRGDSAWANVHDGTTDDEKVVVRQHDDGSTVTVQMLGISEDFTGVTKVVLDGREYGGKIQALFQGAKDGVVYTLPTVVVGGDQADTVKTGSGPVWIDGGGGDDLITTGDRPDLTQATGSPALVTGGDGNDAISVGNSDDTVYGDGNLQIGDGTVQLTLNTTCGDDPCTAGPQSLDVSSIGLPADGDTGTGNDHISVGLGHTTVWGGGGDDVIGVAADSPLAAAHTDATHAQFVSAGVIGHGGPGNDTISAGSGDDVVFTGDTFDPSGMTQDAIADRDASGDAGTTNTVDTGAGNDTVYGGDGVDVVTGHSAGDTVDTFYGGPGQDILMGGYGQDQLWGGQDDDYLIAEPSTVGAPGSTTDVLGSARTVTHTPTTAAPQTKLLVGGGGHDRIYGGDGGALIYGDHRDFTCSSGRTGADPSSDPPSETGVGADDADDLIIGGAGVDDVNAGGGNDTVQAKGGDDYLCGSAGNDAVDAGAGADAVWGGTGNDVVYGSYGPDHLYGNDDDDVVYGGDQDDVVEGNNGMDALFGGNGNDTVVGGTRAAARTDVDANGPGGTAAGDTLFGDVGNDLLIGDNGSAGAGDDLSGRRAGSIADLDQVGSSYGAGDHLYGGDGADSGYGGLGDDVIELGNDNDYGEGNPGADTMSGGPGADDIIGGSSQTPGDPAAKDAAGYPDDGDVIDGDAGDDVIAGDNATIVDTAALLDADAVMAGRGMTVGRSVGLFDLGYAPDPANAGADLIAGGDAADVMFGQGGDDALHGNAGDDYAEGGPGTDQVYGDAGEDDMVGGSLYAESGTGQTTAGQLDAGDFLYGGSDADVVLGDNGVIDRVNQPTASTQGRPGMTERHIQAFDLDFGSDPTPDTSGDDYAEGNDGADVIHGQGGDDRLLGYAGDDEAEGGPGRDWIEGNDGDDDLIGGSSVILDGTADDAAQGQRDTGDVVLGGAGDDLVTGDNAVIARVGTFSPHLFRVGSGGALDTQRSLRLLDLRWGSDYLTAPTRQVAGGDELAGGAGVDAVFGQDGDDLVSGGAGDDYAEGHGGSDTLYGDRTFDDLGVTPAAPAGGWPGSPSGEPDSSAPNGQDDLMGGSSTPAFRDAADQVHGDGGADAVLGDNGSLVRDLLDADGQSVDTVTQAQAAPTPLSERIYAKRYDPASPLPAGAAVVRHGAGGTGVEFCTDGQATCEPAGAYGADDLWGDAGQDTIYGQDGDDHIYGDTGSAAKPIGTPMASVDDGGSMPAGTPADDDLYGGLGDDVMFGEYGEDAMVGDRGGIVDVYQDGSNHFTVDLNQVPKIHYDGFLAGTVTRQVDLQHVVAGDEFLPGDVIPHRGDLQGGDDRMLGGVDHDAMHGGFGNDLMNGGSGGDIVYGDDGADVLWGGKGSDQNTDTLGSTPDCYPGGTFDPNARGDDDRMVDYLFGGKGAPDSDTAAIAGVLGADVLDWRPRGSYGVPGSTTCTADPWPQTVGNGKNATTVDPCSWFVMTELDNATDDDNQHHQGIDWIYGGWDRDVLQADVADNGPNQGDRLLDWNGAYNLYTHCNAAYGGFNDVRQHSPAMQSFLQQFAWSTGAGQTADDVTTPGTSAYDELALAYNTDTKPASGQAFPGTPGHCDRPNACAP
jgi:Ca2+-binding RTX toxin-like protein